MNDKHTNKRTETHACDLISRQDAIDIERRATVDTNPEHFESHQKFVEFMDDAEISSFGRWRWSNGFNTALTAVGIDLKRLPSAQPDWGKPVGDGRPLADSEVIPRLQAIKALIGGSSYAIDRSIEVLEQLSSAQFEPNCNGCKHQPRFSHEEPCCTCANNYENKYKR